LKTIENTWKREKTLWWTHGLREIFVCIWILKGKMHSVTLLLALVVFW